MIKPLKQELQVIFRKPAALRLPQESLWNEGIRYDWVTGSR